VKKTTSLLLALVLVLMFALPSFAVSADPAASATLGQVVHTEYYSDGSYSEIVITEGLSSSETTRGTQTKSGTKGSTFYNANGVQLWRVEITGTFTYDGSTATCTNVTKATFIYDSAWKVTAESCSKSGNKAMGSFTVKRYTLLVPVQTENVSLTLTCSASGTLS